jgi:serine/threonine protein kinase
MLKATQLMSMTQTTPEVTPPGELSCQSCGIQLPPQATFCASCGERVTKKQITTLLEDNRDIATRYRITSLVRRRSPVSLFLATDTELPRPVALRDIDITGLNDEERGNASASVQREYDLLRRQHVPFVIPLIDLRHFQSHLYIVAGWPRDEKGSHSHLHTLQDVLQSGKGLPAEDIALTWIEHLCQSLQDLHAAGIIVADLDPQTLILNGDTYADELALMVSWLPPSLRPLFPRISTIANITNYTAPEVLLGKPEPRSDIYSLGALLYLLLTGTPPEEPIARTQRRLRLPGELNSRSGTSFDDFVSQALALDATDRFSNAHEMRSALIQLRTGSKRTNAAKDGQQKSKASNINNGNGFTNSSILPISTEETLIGGILHNGKHNDNNDDSNEQRLDKIVAVDTILITPLAESSRGTLHPLPPAMLATPTNSDRAIAETIEGTPRPNLLDEWNGQNEQGVPDMPTLIQLQPGQNTGTPVTTGIAGRPNIPFAQRLKRRITVLLPPLPNVAAPRATASTPLQKRNLPVPVSTSQVGTTGSNTVSPQETSNTTRTSSFFQQMQRLILGEQKQTTTAAAIVEAPLRVQPNQHYHIRIHVMGRNTAMGAPDSKNSATAGGLSSLVEGDTVFIEVRSALYQNYAYVVQQATVQIPESGYAAEVTIPMHPLSQGPSGRRDRLHIFFMDARHRSLYEKPFVIELFISHLVQSGREGHNVLTIPL